AEPLQYCRQYRQYCARSAEDSPSPRRLPPNRRRGAVQSSSATVDAPGEEWIALLGVGHRRVRVGRVGAALVEGSDREDRVLRAAVLTNEAAEVAEALPAGELPEGLLAEEQIDRTVHARRGGEGGHGFRRDRTEARRRRAECVEDRQHAGDITCLQLRFGLDEAGVEAPHGDAR